LFIVPSTLQVRKKELPSCNTDIISFAVMYDDNFQGKTINSWNINNLMVLFMKRKEDEKRRIVTVTSKRMITIPAVFAKKYGIKKSTKLEVIDTGKGLLLVPIVSFEDLFGVDDKETAKKIIEGIHQDRKKDIELEE